MNYYFRLRRFWSSLYTFFIIINSLILGINFLELKFDSCLFIVTIFVIGYIIYDLYKTLQKESKFINRLITYDLKKSFVISYISIVIINIICGYLLGFVDSFTGIITTFFCILISILINENFNSEIEIEFYN